MEREREREKEIQQQALLCVCNIMVQGFISQPMEIKTKW